MQVKTVALPIMAYEKLVEASENHPIRLNIGQLAAEAILEKYAKAPAAAAPAAAPPSDPDKGIHGTAVLLLQSSASPEEAMERLKAIRPASLKTKLEAEIVKMVQSGK